MADPKVLNLAWEALYVADSTGPDAGPRLETPIAALRVLHFAELAREQKNPSRSAALDALLATPALPRSFHEARVPPAAAPVAGGPPLATNAYPGASDRSAQLRALAQELVSTERLLGLVSEVPAAAGSALHTGSAVQQDGWRRSGFSVQAASTLRTAFAGRLSGDEASLLDRLRLPQTAAVPAAAQTLQAHLSTLSGQALALGTDREFQGYMRDLTTPLSVASAREAGILNPDWGGLHVINDDGEFAKDVSVAGRIKPLGIGDLKVVKQTLLAYVPGEVAHIENVLKGESKERKHRKLDRTETTLFTSEEETKDTERDTQTTDRFELKREAEQTLKEDMSVKAGLTVTAAYGPVVTTATGDFAYSTSKQDSEKSSSNFAREVVDRSVTKVQTKTKTERTTKTLNEVEEINTHGVDNTQAGADHVIGVYRWVDKRYRAQVYNYGVRLLLEFIVPEPAVFYRATNLERPVDVNATPPEPFLNLAGAPLAPVDIKESTYATYVGRYHAAGVTPPPPAVAFTGAAIVKEGLDLGKTIGMASKDFVVPAGYTLNFYSATVSILWKNHPKFSLQVGRDSFLLLNQNPNTAASISTSIQGVPEEVNYFTGSVPVSVAAYDVASFAINVQGLCVRTPEALMQWQLQTYEKIFGAYQALQTAYDQKVAQAQASGGIAIEGHNPGNNRLVEKTELKKLCITMMTGEHFKRFHAMTEPPAGSKRAAEVDVLEALDEGSIIQFFEQAFEWEQMTYLYYPYFWGRKKNWGDVVRLTDPDPLFGQFLSAGAARVLVPVPIAYKTAVEFLLQSKETDLRRKVWGGGGRPTIDDPLYVSVAEEMRNQTDDLAGATPEGTPWEFTLPTTLVWLQPDGTLPKFSE